ncbi:ATP-binding protein [Pseudorhodoferax sp.]|uniref:ATP-binding protein n=1 Tax=Pseudorhodoferax sp. TaxID=1993553 RepID=UPI0039E50637
MNPGERLRFRAARRLLAALAALALMAASAWLAYGAGEDAGVEQLQAEANHRLDLFASAVEGMVKRSEHVPATIQLNPEVLALLRGPPTPARVAAAGTYLRRLNAHVGSLAAFMLNDRGVVVASSNDSHPDDSRLGTDVSFRPYFLEALSGRVGRHFAIGVDGRTPGYFVSHPIRDGAQVVGVAAIKISLQPIDQTWAMVGAPALLADANGVVIHSSRPDWRYSALVPLTLEQRVDHQLTRLYDDVRIAQFPLSPRLNPARERQRLDDQLILTRPLDGMDWRVMLFLDLQAVRHAARMQAAMAAVAAAFVALLLLVLAQARRIQRQRREARRMLESANAALESKVHARTQDLLDANARLTREVREREQAEQSLRAAQNELVQAAKMAVMGQLAAGITHELTQPLGAIRTLSGNAEEFLRRGQMEPLAGNLQIIARLADQMGGIIQPLKAFARKSDAVLGATDIGQTFSNALFLYGLRLRRMRVRVDNGCPPGAVFAWCDANRLEQVLINLIGNALDAMAATPEPCLGLRAGHCAAPGGGARRTWIDVEDNGAGLSPRAREQLFEPFFTTKAPGAGLGLGLVISRDIVRGFGGDIQARDRPGGGTVFRVLIPAEAPSTATPT